MPNAKAHYRLYLYLSLAQIEGRVCGRSIYMKRLILRSKMTVRR